MVFNVSVSYQAYSMDIAVDVELYELHDASTYKSNTVFLQDSPIILGFKYRPLAIVPQQSEEPCWHNLSRPSIVAKVIDNTGKHIFADLKKPLFNSSAVRMPTGDYYFRDKWYFMPTNLPPGKYRIIIQSMPYSMLNLRQVNPAELEFEIIKSQSAADQYKVLSQRSLCFGMSMDFRSMEQSLLKLIELGEYSETFRSLSSFYAGFDSDRALSCHMEYLRLVNRNAPKSPISIPQKNSPPLSYKKDKFVKLALKNNLAANRTEADNLFNEFIASPEYTGEISILTSEDYNPIFEPKIIKKKNNPNASINHVSIVINIILSIAFIVLLLRKRQLRA